MILTRRIFLVLCAHVQEANVCFFVRKGTEIHKMRFVVFCEFPLSLMETDVN